MKTFARIEDGTVRELIGIPNKMDITTMFHPSLIWVPCDGDVQVGYTLHNGTFSPPPGPDLEETRKARQGELVASCNRFIETLPSGLPRYDINLKLNMFAYDSNLNREPVRSVFRWIRAVQGAYYGQKALLKAAQDLEALGAVDVSYEWFESRYGVEGSELKDPDISTADLMVED
jgi:hypothetical protein